MTFVGHKCNQGFTLLCHHALWCISGCDVINHIWMWGFFSATVSVASVQQHTLVHMEMTNHIPVLFLNS